MDDYRGYCPIPKEQYPDYEKQELMIITNMVFMKGFLTYAWIGINYMIWLVRLFTLDWAEVNFRNANLFTHIVFSAITVIVICLIIKKPKAITKIKLKHWMIAAYFIFAAIFISGVYNEYHKYWF